MAIDHDPQRLARQRDAGQARIELRVIGKQGIDAHHHGTASRAQLNVILPLTVFLIFLLLFMLYSNVKFPFITVLGVVLSAPVGGIVALWLTHTPFSVSSGIGFLALFGVSVQTAVVYISCVNELRRGGAGIAESIREGAILRLRPIMMTALVAWEPRGWRWRRAPCPLRHR